MSKKPKIVGEGCKGAGRWAKRKMPTSLVDCPECARKNLGSKPIRDAFDLDDHGEVPFHRPAPLGPDQIPDFDPKPDTLEQMFKDWCDSPEWDRRGHAFDDPH